jgi:GAF domain-containing protein
MDTTGVSTLPPLLLLLMMGALMAGAILNLWIWLLRPRKSLHLWTAGWCTISGFYLLSHYIQRVATAPQGVLLGSRLTWFSALTLAPVMVGLTHSIVARRCSWRPLIFLGGMQVVLAWMLAFTEMIVTDRIYLRSDWLGGLYWASVPGPLVLVPIPYLFGISIYCVVLIWRAAQLEPTERRVIFASFGIYILFALNDALHAARLIQSVRIFDLAFVPVAGVLTYLEVRRYANLSESLEVEVAARTRELRGRQDELSALIETGRGLAERLDLATTTSRVLTTVLEVLRAKRANLYRLDAESGTLTCIACSDDADPLRWRGRMVGRGEGTTGRAVELGHVVSTTDLLVDPHLKLPEWAEETLRQDALRAVASVPLKVGDKIIGALNIADEVGRIFTPAQLELLTAFGDQAAVAIENAGLYTALEDRVRRLDALTHLNQAVSASLDVGRILHEIAAAAASLMEAALVIVWTVDASGDAVSARATSNDPLFATHPKPNVRFGEGIVGRVAATRRPLSAPDLAIDPRADGAQWFIANGFRAGAAFPILHGDELLGVLSLVFPTPSDQRIEDDPLLKAFIAQAAIAIDHGRLYRGLEERVSQLHTLTRLNRLISSSLDSERVLGEIARAAAQLPGVSVASFWLADEASKTLTLVGFSDPTMDADFPRRTISFDQGVMGWVARHGRLLNVADAPKDGRVVAPDWWRHHGLSSFLGVPVILDGSLLAVLALNGREPFRLDTEDERLLEGFVGQAALAVRNATLFAAEGAARAAAERALAEVKQLQGMLPICSYCKKIRNDENSWEQLESYIIEHSPARFSHGICPECRTRVARDFELWKARR